ncbi:hypothetical protein RIF29_22876 [Crotalaria pallida]|uniref:Exocyst subunit Exo70 family protein n=1 Tax=Crotalaria pallida TaxID=3830 RepID=A0AAN9I757_CROPI
MEKSFSFSSRNSGTRHRRKLSEALNWEEVEEVSQHHHYHHHHDLPKVLEEVDHFLHNTATHTSYEFVPDCVLLLPKLLDSMMDKYNAGKRGNNQRSKFGQDSKDDKCFVDVLDRISKLSNTLSTSTALDKITSILEKSMCFLENDLIYILQHKKSIPSSSNSYSYESQLKTPKKPPKKTFSFSSLSLSDSDLTENESNKGTPDVNKADEEFSSLSKEKVSILNKIATTMINAGYDAEFYLVFADFRRIDFQNALQRFGYNAISMEEIYRMQWESLEGEITTWINLVNHCTVMLFKSEMQLYDSVFQNQNSISRTLFSDLARGVILQFLNFVQGVVLTKQSAEKLFKFLDMYETLNHLESVIIDESYEERCRKELEYEITTTKSRVVEAVVAMFFDLQNSIKSDYQRIPVPNGAIHPLARYVMNYVRYVCEYRDALEQIFQVHQSLGKKENYKFKINDQRKMEDGTPNTSSFSVQLMTVMDLLDENIERKSKLYRDPSLRCVFLMNNGRYIVQKIKGSVELHESMGDNWCRKKQSSLRLYHKSYQRETWSKVIQCLNPENLQLNGNKVSKQVLKERFKCFNAMFEEVHKTQSTWVVNDAQLQSELRVSITALVIPAYRSFFGRYKKEVEKYIKYHPEDIEALIEDLFGGNSSSMARRRT